MTRFHQKVSIAIVVLFMTAFINAEAQRTMKGQSVIGAETSFNGISAGTTINYSQYTLNGFWYVGISGNDYYALYSDSDIFRYNHICGYGGYLFRLVGTRSRSINLYGGGEIIVGMEVIDPFNELPYQFKASMEKYRFLYGVCPKILAEFFISPRFAFTIFGTLPINFSSAISNVNYNIGGGFRIML